MAELVTGQLTSCIDRKIFKHSDQWSQMKVTHISITIVLCNSSPEVIRVTQRHKQNLELDQTLLLKLVMSCQCEESRLKINIKNMWKIIHKCSFGTKTNYIHNGTPEETR